MTVDGNSKSLPRGVNLSKVGDDPNKDHDEEKSKDADEETPKGKICCLLCRGFISYKNSDRTRFRDHMANEHDVKFDSDVILAVSVMSAREKQHIVAGAMSRLAEIGNNQLPSTAELLLPCPAAQQVPAPASRVPVAVITPQVRRVSSGGRRVSESQDEETQDPRIPTPIVGHIINRHRSSKALQMESSRPGEIPQ